MHGKQRINSNSIRIDLINQGQMKIRNKFMKYEKRKSKKNGGRIPEKNDKRFKKDRLSEKLGNLF